MARVPNIRWLKDENWKTALGASNYMASTMGRVARFTAELGWYLVGNVHFISMRYDDGRLRHRPRHQVILETFVGPRPPGMLALHDPDPNYNNCRLSNLRWGTHQENMDDNRRHIAAGLRPEHWTRRRRDAKG